MHFKIWFIGNNVPENQWNPQVWIQTLLGELPNNACDDLYITAFRQNVLGEFHPLSNH